LVAEGFLDILQQEEIDFEVIAGTSTAGIPHSTTLADMLGTPLTYLRTKAKDQGMGNQIEGLGGDRSYHNRKVVLIEDLISTGGSSIKAVQAVREAEGDITWCLAIFSYGLEKARTQFAEMVPECNTRTILDYNTLIKVARRQGAINPDEERLLLSWRDDPFGWGKKHGFPPKREVFAA